jgi:hypothetical protein
VLAAAAGGGLPVLTTAHANRTEPAGIPDRVRFNITLRFLTPVSDAHRAIFEAAAARWQRIIIGDVPSITGTVPKNLCLKGAPAFTGTVDDVLIDVVLEPMDGLDRAIGGAGACLVRTADMLPTYGFMRFDTADIPTMEREGYFVSTVEHEMGHVLGMGAVWNFGRQLRLGTGTDDPVFAGETANTQYVSLGGTGAVPIENTGGPGTRDVHWRESVFGTELMTGWVFAGESVSPLSRVTAGSLRDLGYVTSLTADPFALEQPSTSAGAAATSAPKRGLNIGAAERLSSPLALVAPAP